MTTFDVVLLPFPFTNPAALKLPVSNHGGFPFNT